MNETLHEIWETAPQLALQDLQLREVWATYTPHMRTRVIEAAETMEKLHLREVSQARGLAVNWTEAALLAATRPGYCQTYGTTPDFSIVHCVQLQLEAQATQARFEERAFG